jgi:hypothetical protein
MIGQPFIIENRPSAGGNIAAEAVVRATPDDYPRRRSRDKSELKEQGETRCELSWLR